MKKFDIELGSWKNALNVECEVKCEKFSSGAFRDAFHVTTKQEKCVLKKYNRKATDTILNTLKSNVENHCRKQVQMHWVARHIASKFKRSAPFKFGQWFTYNRCYYTSFDGQPAAIEEYVPGDFTKYINKKNGECIVVPEDASQVLKDLYEKSECLLHYSYVVTDHKLMLLDIQGSESTLYNPEIATEEIVDADGKEVYFCCGNCSTLAIEAFLSDHKCNKYSYMMELK